MGDTKQTTESGLSSKSMQAAGNTIGSQLNTQLKAGVKPYTESMVPALSSQTQAGIGALSNNPNDSIYGAGVSSALANQAGIAGGNIENDAVRQRVADDAGLAVNATFANSGRFGGGSHREGLGEGVASALASHDYGRQQQAIQNLPGLYQAGMMPAAAQLQAGGLMDAYNTATAEDKARIFDATSNAGWNTLQRGAAIFGGTAPVSGTTSTQTTQVPWWQQALGGGLMASGIYGNFQG